MKVRDLQKSLENIDPDTDVYVEYGGMNNPLRNVVLGEDLLPFYGSMEKERSGLVLFHRYGDESHVDHHMNYVSKCSSYKILPKDAREVNMDWIYFNRR